MVALSDFDLAGETDVMMVGSWVASMVERTVEMTAVMTAGWLVAL